MKTTKLNYLKSGAAPLVLGFAILAGPALAQSAPPAEAAAEDNAPIVVTGSRIATRPEYAGANPITVIDAAAIEETGQTNLTEALATNPALLGSDRSIDNAGSNLPNSGLVGVNFLDLRNLGTDRTLVLVDGRRHVAGYPGTAAVDINSIPTDLVERVDVLTGGVSAVYGADGVSGVVNFILKKDFEGLRLRAQNKISARGDAGERFIAATAGKNFSDGRGNVTIAYEFNETDRFSQRSRLNYGLTGPTYRLVRNPADGSPGSEGDDPNVPDRVLLTNLRWADSSMGGAIDFTGDGVPEFTGEGTPYDLGSYVPGTPFTVGGDSTPVNSYYGDHIPYTRRHVVNFMGHYEFSPALNFYVEAKYLKSKAYTEGQPTYDLYTALAPDNAYLVQRFGPEITSEGALFSRDHFDFGTRRSQLDRELFRVVTGFNGTLSPHLRYDASFVYGQSTQTSTDFNERITDRFYAAIDAVDDGSGNITCRINLPGQTDISSLSYGNTRDFNGPPETFQPGQCVPLNILGNGSPSAAALAFIQANQSNYSRIRQYVATATVSGDTGAFFNLPGGPVGFAIGAEYRKETSFYSPSEYRLNNQLLDNSGGQVENGKFDVKEAFAEVRLPLLSDVPFAKELSVGGALRLSDYSTVGNTTTWSVNSTYSPVRDITFRGTYSKSVRAPNISELFSPQSGTFEFITDPCGVDRLAEGTQYRAANCATALNAVGIDPTDFNPAESPFSPQNTALLGVQGGNPALGAEEAKTWTAGIVLRPNFVPGLMLSFDWYDIKLSKAIQYSTAQDIVDLCYDQPTLENDYCSLISRSSSNGFVSNFQVVPANVASFKTAGLDMNLYYRIGLGDKLGQLTFKLTGNYLDKLEFVPSLGAEPENELDSATYPAPRFSATFDLTWAKGPFTLNYGIDWFDRTRRVTREQEAANPDYAPSDLIWYREKWEHQIYMAYDVEDKFQIYAGVNNLFDRKPDDGAVAYPVSAEGRSFYVGFKAKVF